MKWKKSFLKPQIFVFKKNFGSFFEIIKVLFLTCYKRTTMNVEKYFA